VLGRTLLCSSARSLVTEWHADGEKCGYEGLGMKTRRDGDCSKTSDFWNARGMRNRGLKAPLESIHSESNRG
jgi:hypothetical protein